MKTTNISTSACDVFRKCVQEMCSKPFFSSPFSLGTGEPWSHSRSLRMWSSWGKVYCTSCLFLFFVFYFVWPTLFGLLCVKCLSGGSRAVARGNPWQNRTSLWALPPNPHLVFFLKQSFGLHTCTCVWLGRGYLYIWIMHTLFIFKLVILSLFQIP